MNDVATQLNATAFIPRPVAIAGSATLIEEARNGVRNEAMVATTSAERRIDCSAASTFICPPILQRWFAVSMQ